MIRSRQQRTANLIYKRAKALKPGDNAADLEQRVHSKGRALIRSALAQTCKLDLDGDRKADVAADTNLDEARTLVLVEPQRRDEAVFVELNADGYVTKAATWGDFTDADTDVLDMSSLYSATQRPRSVSKFLAMDDGGSTQSAAAPTTSPTVEQPSQGASPLASFLLQQQFD